jgi:glycosyltransferase involved in cell wall biosynthesis
VQKVTLIANGPEGSAAEVRAARIAAALDGFDVDVLFRKGRRLADAQRFAQAARRAAVVYAVDLAGAPLLGARFRSSSAKLIVDTGDAPSAFLHVVNARRSTIAAARAMEMYAYRSARAFVVRGTYHSRFLREQGFEKAVHVVPDGVDLGAFHLVDGNGLRERLGLTDAFTVGIQGHFTWYPRLGGGLGWELLHAIALRRDLPLHAVLIGDGPGIRELRRLARELGIWDRLHVMGQVPYRSLAPYLAICDVCLLTQTNDPASWVRTSGKLPVYLAAGRYLLATKVGTAVDVLPDEMLLDYHGSWDHSYPARLVDAIARVARDPARVDKGWALRGLAPRFDYHSIAARAADVVRGLAA